MLSLDEGQTFSTCGEGPYVHLCVCEGQSQGAHGRLEVDTGTALGAQVHAGALG